MRAQQTAQAVLERIDVGSLASVVADERLREKEFGIFDRLTAHGIASKYPELHEQRQHVGKIYFRPPGGESWCDVILRLRSVLDTITRKYRADRRPPGHRQLLRYLLERCDEQAILSIDKAADMPNCGVTPYAFNPALGRHGKLQLDLCNFVAPLEAAAPRHGPARYAGRAEILMLRGHAWTLSTSHIPYITPPLRRSWRHKNNSISISRKNR